MGGSNGLTFERFYLLLISGSWKVPLPVLKLGLDKLAQPFYI